VAYQDIAIAILFLIFVLLILWLFRKKPPLKYKRVNNIFTASEKRFYRVLQEVVGDRYVIFAKVRVADVLLPISTKDRSRWRSAFNKVACKHFDYVLCDHDLRILAAIELDDPSHNKKDRQERDIFLEWACKSAGFPLIRIKTAKHYDIGDLRRRLQSMGG